MEVKRLLFLVTEDWFFVLHRLPLARAAMRAGYEVIVATRVGDCREQLEIEGIRLIHIPWKRGSKNPIDSINSLISVARVYKRYRPDIVHHVSMKSIVIGTFALIFLGIASPHAVVNNYTGMGTLFISDNLGDKLLRWVIILCLRVLYGLKKTHQLVENEDDRNLLIREMKLRDGDVSVIHSVGVDLQRFRPGEKRGEVPIIALASRLIWDKGIGELIEAGKLLRERGLAFRLVLVGRPDPENRSSIPQETLRSWQDSGLVELWGYRNDIDVVWRSVDIAVLPSYREGSPRSLIEAAASGLPVVATDVPGCRDVVKHGKSGFLVPVSDVEALVNALAPLLRESGLRERMGKAGRDYVSSMFNEERVIESTLNLYRSLLAGRKN
jgi:glycosyltransferase involved in cell wall biosynthesis